MVHKRYSIDKPRGEAAFFLYTKLQMRDLPVNHQSRLNESEGLKQLLNTCEISLGSVNH
jgi:hypothetical protein